MHPHTRILGVLDDAELSVVLAAPDRKRGLSGRTRRAARRSAPLGAILALALIVGAGSQPAAAQTPVVRDSAGVRIVENRAPAWGPGEAWRVETEALVSIGEEDGDEAHWFIRVHDGTVLSDGTVVVAVAYWGPAGTQTFALRYFDPEGGHLRTAGRYGEGPWEFRQPRGVHRMAGDSILVHDRNRFAVFGPRGEHGRTGLFGPVSFVDDTGLVSGATLVGVVDAPTETASSGVRTWFRSVTLADLRTGDIDTLGVLVPSDISFVGEGGALPIPFGPIFRMARPAGGQGLAWIGDPDEGKLKGFSADGTPEVIARFPPQDRVLDPELAQLWRDGPYEEWLNLNERIGMDMRRHRAYPQWDHLPSTVPAYSGLVADAIGNVWVQRYPLSSEGVGTPARDLWDIYDPTGIWQGMVEFPPEVTGCEPVEVSVLMVACDVILDIGDEYVLILHRDALRVERVRVHRLVKP